MTSGKVCTVQLSNLAQKDLRGFRGPQLAQIVRAINTLETNPDAGHWLAGTLNGLRSLKFTIKGSGAFRAVYGQIDDGTVCLVVIVGPHENLYREAERRVQALRKAGIIP